LFRSALFIHVCCVRCSPLCVHTFVPSPFVFRFVVTSFGRLFLCLRSFRLLFVVHSRCVDYVALYVFVAALPFGVLRCLRCSLRLTLLLFALFVAVTLFVPSRCVVSLGRCLPLRWVTLLCSFPTLFVHSRCCVPVPRCFPFTFAFVDVCDFHVADTRLRVCFRPCFRWVSRLRCFPLVCSFVVRCSFRCSAFVLVAAFGYVVPRFGFVVVLLPFRSVYCCVRVYVFGWLFGLRAVTFAFWFRCCSLLRLDVVCAVVFTLVLTYVRFHTFAFVFVCYCLFVA